MFLFLPFIIFSTFFHRHYILPPRTRRSHLLSLCHSYVHTHQFLAQSFLHLLISQCVGSRLVNTYHRSSSPLSLYLDFYMSSSFYSYRHISTPLIRYRLACTSTLSPFRSTSVIWLWCLLQYLYVILCESLSIYRKNANYILYYLFDLIFIMQRSNRFA